MVGGAPLSLTSARQRALLAALALSPARPVSVDSLAAFLWGEELPARVRGSLHTHVMRLRRLVGEDVVVTTPDGYRLRVDSDDVDALKFLRLLDKAAELAGVEPEGSVEEHRLLAAALELWRGTPLTGIGSAALEQDWAPLLTERYLLAVERRVDLESDSGAESDLAAELTELLARYPLRESLWERLVTVLARSGRRAEALARYAKLRDLLAEELGVEPGARLQALHRELLSEDAPIPVETGRGQPPRQLPFDVARFTGRAAEIAELDAFLAGQDGRSTSIVVLEGTAGAGKTSLAVHWAHRVRDRFPDGQLFVDLRGHSAETPITPDAALGRFLRAAGVNAELIPSTVEERSALLRSHLAGRRLLLLLDNAHDADQVRPLLPGSGHLVLVTSRSQLRGLVAREGAHRLALGSLDEHGAAELLARAVGRARFDAEPAAAVELAELCGRLPLALALAGERASRFGDMSIAELVEELRDQHLRLDTLSDPQDTGADLRAAFSWSYRALRPAAARMFRLLGLHPGVDIGRGAAAALSGLDARAARDLLEQLAGTHLLNQPGADRHQFHDLLRVYAVELLEETESTEERDAAFGRLLDWYLCALAEASRQIRPDLVAAADVVLPENPGPPVRFTDRVGASAWYVRERGTVVALVAAAARQGWARHAWQLGWLLRGFTAERHDVDDWVETARHGVNATAEAGDGTGFRYAANNLGSALLRASRTEEALEILRRGLSAPAPDGNPLTVAILSNLAGAYYLRQEFAEAYRYGSAGLDAARSSGQNTYIAHAELTLSAICIGLEDFDEAVEHALRAKEAFESQGDLYHAALTLGNIAEATAKSGRYAEAEEAARQGLDRLREFGADYGSIDVLITLGGVLLATGRAAEGREIWLDALEVCRRLNDPRTAEVQALLASNS